MRSSRLVSGQGPAPVEQMTRALGTSELAGLGDVDARLPLQNVLERNSPTALGEAQITGRISHPRAIRSPLRVAGFAPR